jgi:hypothetical protein
MKEVWIGKRSIVGETDPLTWTNAKSVASGKTSHSASTHFSPPRMEVNHSCTIAIRCGPGELIP